MAYRTGLFSAVRVIATLSVVAIMLLTVCLYNKHLGRNTQIWIAGEYDLGAEFCKVLDCSAKNIFIDNPSVEINMMRLVGNGLHLPHGNINWHRAESSFGTNDHVIGFWIDDTGVVIRKLKVLIDSIFRPLMTDMRSGISGRSSSTVFPSNIEAHELATRWIVMNTRVMYKSSLGDSGSLVNFVGYYNQSPREVNEQGGEHHSPKCGLFIQEHLTDVVPNEVDEFLYFHPTITELLSYVVSLFGVICLIFCFATIGMGIECSRRSYFAVALTLFVIGWYLSGLSFWLSHI
jgi:hypothetical protein